MKPLLVVKTGDTLTQLADRFGNFEDWIKLGLGCLQIPVEIFDPRQQASMPSLTGIAGAVVTGSHSMVTDQEPWSQRLACWLASLVENDVPVMGICYGHQLLAHALGGEVGYRPNGREIGTVTVSLERGATHDAIFAGMKPAFPAHAVHQQSVFRLPPGAVLLATTVLEPHAAFRIGRSAWGVQFHPEFSANVMSAYIRHLAPDLNAEGHDIDPLLKNVGHADVAASILHRFGCIAAKRCLDMADTI